MRFRAVPIRLHHQPILPHSCDRCRSRRDRRLRIPMCRRRPCSTWLFSRHRRKPTRFSRSRSRNWNARQDSVALRNSTCPCGCDESMRTLQLRSFLGARQKRSPSVTPSSRPRAFSVFAYVGSSRAVADRSQYFARLALSSSALASSQRNRAQESRADLGHDEKSGRARRSRLQISESFPRGALPGSLRSTLASFTTSRVHGTGSPAPTGGSLRRSAPSSTPPAGRTGRSAVVHPRSAVDP